MTSQKPVMPLVLLAVLLAFPAPSEGANFFDGNGTDNLWSNPDNWSIGVVPINDYTNPNAWDDHELFGFELTPGDTSDDGPLGNNDAQLTDDGATTNQINVLVDDSVHAKAYGVRVGRGGSNATLEITGGILDIGGGAPGEGGRFGRWHLDIGRGFNQTGDPNTKQRVVMTGGTVNTNGLLIPEQFVDDSLFDANDPLATGNSEPLNGELIMSGGTMNARWMNLGQLRGNGSAKLSGDSVVNLVNNVVGQPANGGHLEFNRSWNVAGNQVAGTGTVSLDIADNAIINIFGHRTDSIVDPDEAEVARYQGYVDSGELTADDGTDAPTIFLFSEPGEETIIKICALDADFDSDCDVDDDDWMAWENGYTMTGTPGDLKAMGDADNDGDVDGADFLELQREYGVGMNNEEPVFLQAVPEPTSLCLAALSAIAIGLRRQRGVETT